VNINAKILAAKKVVFAEDLPERYLLIAEN
jgi:hypothetical protein